MNKATQEIRLENRRREKIERKSLSYMQSSETHWKPVRVESGMREA